MNDLIALITDALKREGIYSPEVLAYALATIKYETGGTMRPIPEYGGPSNARRFGYSGGEKYYGRGYIQLTHDYNYKQMGRRIGLGDALYKNPDLALNPEISARILAAFFKDRGVAKKVMEGDIVGARRQINPDNKGRLIANYAKQFLPLVVNASSQSSQQPSQQSSQPQTITFETPKPTPQPSFIQKIQNAIKSILPQKTSYSPSTPTYYTVKPGDTLSKIAQQYYANPMLYNKISGYRSENPNLIYPWEKLKIA